MLMQRDATQNFVTCPANLYVNSRLQISATNRDQYRWVGCEQDLLAYWYKRVFWAIKEVQIKMEFFIIQILSQIFFSGLPTSALWKTEGRKGNQ